MKKTILLLVCTILLTGTAWAQNCETEKVFSDWSFTMDNDTFTRFMGLGFLNEDRNYTQGGEFALNSPRLACFIRGKIEDAELHTKIDNYRSPLSYQEPSKIFLRYAAFSPDDLRQKDPIIGDRPYASVVWLGLNFNWLDQQEYTRQSWEFSLGMMGIPGLAEGIQTAIHKPQNENNTKPPYNPEGWSNQVSEGGEPTLLLSYSKKNLVTKTALVEESSNNNPANVKKFRGQLTKTFNVDLGHVVQGGLGLEFRLGKLDLRNWYINPSRNVDAMAVAGGPFASRANHLRQDSFWEIYFYGDARASIMLYNGSLHGQFRSSAYTLPWKETGFVYGTSRFGVMIKSKNFLFSPYVGLKTPEFWNENSRIHAWAGFTLNRAFRSSRK